MRRLLTSLLNGIESPGKSFCSCAPDPPPAPNYTQAAKDQGAANIEAARVQSRMNNPNVVGPYGTQQVTWGTFNQPGFDAARVKYGQDLTDYYNRTNGIGREAAAKIPRPVAPTVAQFTSNADTPTLTQTLNHDQQALLDQSTATKLQLSKLAGQGASTAGEVIGKNLDLSTLPSRPGSADETRTKVLDAMMARVNEDADRQQGLLQSKLLASGIPAGSKAYDDAMALEARKRTDAANQAYLASGQEMTRDFQTDSQRRRDALGELLTERQTPLNEITALMSGSQVSNPFSIPGYAQNAQVQAAPLFAAQNALADYNTDIYNAKAAQMGNLQQGLFGLGAAGIGAYGAGASDRRLKSNIVLIGQHPIGVPLYEYDIEGRRERGVMADELEAVRPDAVLTGDDGYQRVRYDLIGGREGGG